MFSADRPSINAAFVAPTGRATLQEAPFLMRRTLKPMLGALAALATATAMSGLAASGASAASS